MEDRCPQAPLPASVISFRPPEAWALPDLPLFGPQQTDLQLCKHREPGPPGIWSGILPPSGRAGVSRDGWRGQGWEDNHVSGRVTEMLSLLSPTKCSSPQTEHRVPRIAFTLDPWGVSGYICLSPWVGMAHLSKWDLNPPLPQLMVSARVQKAQRDSPAVIGLYIPQAICSLHLASSLSDTAVTVTSPAGTLELGPWGQECPWGTGSTESLVYYPQPQSASPGPRAKDGASPGPGGRGCPNGAFCFVSTVSLITISVRRT